MDHRYSKTDKAPAKRLAVFFETIFQECASNDGPG